MFLSAPDPEPPLHGPPIADISQQSVMVGAHHDPRLRFLRRNARNPAVPCVWAIRRRHMRRAVGVIVAAFFGVSLTLYATSVLEFPTLPTANAAPTAITKAADGSLWFTEKNANRVARITTAGVLTEYNVPTANSGPERITASPDGYVWFTERTGGRIGRIRQSGRTIAEFVVPGVGAFPTAITTDLTGKVWFASSQQPGTARIGSISSAGAI